MVRAVIPTISHHMTQRGDRRMDAFLIMKMMCRTYLLCGSGACGESRRL